MGRPRLHDESRAETLLDEAERLLASGGPDAVSVRAVADAADTTTRAVYTLFGGKEGLIHRLCERGYRDLVARVASVSPTDDPAADLVEVGITGFRAFATNSPHLYRLTFERVTRDLLADPEVAATAFATYDALCSFVKRLDDADGLGGQSVERTVFQFHSLCQGLATSELQRQRPPIGSSFWPMVDDEDVDTGWRTALTAYVRGLSAA
jgi:AcrR family transcriptional regulator